MNYISQGLNMKSPKSVKALEDFGRVQLSKSFFMREFLHSEISQIEQMPNIPKYPDIAIEAGKALCENVLEPIQESLGRISVRSSYRSCTINAKGNEKGHSCANNESNYASHIWDMRDSNGFIGATACIVVTSFVPYYEKTKNWQALAWWVHDNIPNYSSMCFFPKLAAFNITWYGGAPKKTISSYIAPKGRLTKLGMKNQNESHREIYADYLQAIKT